MKTTVQLIAWVTENYDLIMALLGELLVACVTLLGAIRVLIKVFAQLADLTATNVDNRAVAWLSDVCDAVAATLDRVRRVIPRPALPPSPSVQPITTKTSRAAAANELGSMRVITIPYARPLPPLESKPPPPMADELVDRPPPAGDVEASPAALTNNEERAAELDSLTERKP